MIVEETQQYIGTFELPTRNGTLKIFKKPISARDLLLFEEKKLDPQSTAATLRSVGLIAACEWFIPNMYDVAWNDTAQQPLSPELMDSLQLEMPHLLFLINMSVQVMGEIIFHDNALEVADSDHFTYGDWTVERMKMSWRDTPQMLQLQSRKDLTRTNINLICKYFKVNGEFLKESDMKIPGGIDLRIMVLIITRLGKLLVIQ